MRKSRIILAKTKADASGRMGNANVDFIYKQYDVAGVEAYK
ncbi:phage portal protein, partial [Staphylococcus pseudintermedius]